MQIEVEIRNSLLSFGKKNGGFPILLKEAKTMQVNRIKISDDAMLIYSH